MSKRILSITLVVTIAVATPIIFFKVRNARAKASKRESEVLKGLTSNDLAEVLKSHALSDRDKADAITKTPESRKAFLKGMSEYLSLAARARREGMGEGQDARLNLQIKENGLLADLYSHKIRQERKEPLVISKEQIAAVWTNPENEKQFKAEFDALYAVQNAAAENMESKLGAQPQPQGGEVLEKTRTGWARARILSKLARADAEFMQQRTTQLRLKILEAGVLSTAYLAKYWKNQIKATDEDIKAYLAAHSEFDLTKKREKAEMVLRRAKAGEDFAALAKEFSEDRQTKDKGGLYDNYEQGAGLWEEVERAALGLKTGQIADKLVETKDGYHIVQLMDKTVTKAEDGKETVYLSVRHILLQRRFEDPTVNRAISSMPPPFKTPEEIAKTAVEKVKRQAFIDAIVKAENISMPDDFEF